MAKHIRIIPARRVRRPHITSRLPHIAERPAIPRQAWQGSRAQHPASALSAARAESPCEKARLPCKKSRVCERFHPHSMERSNQRPGNSRRHPAFLRSKTAENGARIVHNPGFFAQESEKPPRAGRRTLQSGTWILFQGEVKFLTGGDPIDDGSDARRRASGGRRRSAVRDPEAFRSGDRCQTRLEREGAIRGNPKADSGGNPGPTVTVRMEEAEIRNEARAHRQLAMDADRSQPAWRRKLRAGFADPTSLYGKESVRARFLLQAGRCALPSEDLRERGSP